MHPRTRGDSFPARLGPGALRGPDGGTPPSESSLAVRNPPLLVLYLDSGAVATVPITPHHLRISSASPQKGPDLRLSLSQTPRMEQRLGQSPQMIQAMQILQLSSLDLMERIEQELMENPFLEVVEPTAEEESGPPQVEEKDAEEKDAEAKDAAEKDAAE